MPRCGCNVSCEDVLLASRPEAWAFELKIIDVCAVEEYYVVSDSFVVIG